MRRNIAFALSICLALPMPMWAEQQGASPSGNLEVSASALGSLVLGQKIKLMTRDGTYAEGKVLRASLDEIQMEISKSEPKGRLPAGEAVVRTSDIAVVHMKKNGSIAAPVALGVVGGLLGYIIAAYAAEHVHNDSAYFAIGIAAAAGGATGGAVLGRETVKKTITINVTPGR